MRWRYKIWEILWILGRGYEGREFNYPRIQPMWRGKPAGRELGHGFGLASAEPPYIVPEYMVPRDKTYVLEPGVVFSILPYLGELGIGGIRLEDNVVDTDNGMDVISRFPYDNRLLR